jgi:hypothetical protein
MDIATILTNNYPGSEWYLNGDDYSGLTWLSSDKKPTKKELEDQWTKVIENLAEKELSKKQTREAILLKLGLTEEEAKVLLS